MAIAKFDLAAWQEFIQKIEPSGYQATPWSTQPADASAPVRPLPATAGQTQYIDMERPARRGKHPATSLKAPSGLAVPSTVHVLLHWAFPSPLVKHLCPEVWQQPV